MTASRPAHREAHTAHASREAHHDEDHDVTASDTEQTRGRYPQGAPTPHFAAQAALPLPRNFFYK
ncbi:hypothetical protein SAMN04489835_4225 [Mycolicibacterium rutilum]|uniref:Uncharacterized protein n=1 Tax=Mycolicibacterium rutilum TaxID=370526 RepID=A0A1H6KUG3_MYCRU|nr:hypothetical protein SAMN04489835_4225 [Mycolicibacterium rutilum]